MARAKLVVRVRHADGITDPCGCKCRGLESWASAVTFAPILKVWEIGAAVVAALSAVIGCKFDCSELIAAVLQHLVADLIAAMGGSQVAVVNGSNDEAGACRLKRGCLFCTRKAIVKYDFLGQCGDSARCMIVRKR